MWESPASLWADAANKSPMKYRPVYNFGVTLMDSSPDLAEENFRKTIQLRPELPLAYRSLAQIKRNQEDLESAEQLWGVALGIDSDHRETFLALSRLHLEKKEFFAGCPFAVVHFCYCSFLLLSLFAVAPFLLLFPFCF